MIACTGTTKDEQISSMAGEPIAGEPMAGEPMAGEPMAGEPMAGEMIDTSLTTEEVYEGLRPICSACHSAGLSLPAFASLADFNRLIVTNQQWIVPGEPDQSALLNLLLGTYAGSIYTQMPPSGAPYALLINEDPSAPSIDEIRTWIEQLEITGEPEPEPITCANTPLKGAMARLSKEEYRNTIRDILGSHLDPSADFPSENESYGFSHISTLLTLSPLLIEKYDLAAIALAEEAVPKHTRPLETFVLEAENDLSSTVGAASGEYWNLWSNGLISTFFNPPEAGRYEITMAVSGGQAGPDPVRFALVIDGQDVEVFESRAQRPDRDQITTTVNLVSSEHEIGIRFLNDYYCTQERFDLGECAGVGDRNLLVDRLVITGPQSVIIPPSNFELRYLDCDPEQEGFEPCARSILTRFGRLAWRRPLSMDELNRLWALMNAEVSADAPTLNQWRDGLRQAVHAILLSSHFIFRVELSPEGTSLNGYERASRLAAFIWRSSPDEALLNAVAQGDLDTLSGQSAQIERMLSDPKAQALIQDFGGRFMQLHHLDDLEPDYQIFPQFTPSLRASMKQEMRLALQSIMVEERSLLDLVNLDFTWINQELALFYGLEDAYNSASGDEYRRISLPQAGRKGLLTQGAWLTVTSHPTRTSPVLRGKWVLENLLCTPPPPPPPSVEGLPESGVDQNASVRERLEQHRADPACAACHTQMDSIGFAFESFSGIGEFRLVDGNDVIDPSGILTLDPPLSFENSVDLVDGLRNEPALSRCVTERMIIYALGRGLADNEHCFVDQIMTQADQYSLQSLARAIAGSVLMTQQGETR